MPARSTYDAIVAGYLGVDMAPGFRNTGTTVPFGQLFRPGKLVEVSSLSMSLGGVVANTGLAMQRFGQKVGLMGCVGNDSLGEMVVAQLGEKGSTAGIKRKTGVGTSYGIVIAPPGTDRMFLEDPGCNGAFTSQDIDYKLVAQSRLFHLGYPPLMTSLWENEGNELKRIYSRIRKLGIATSLDMALPDPNSPAGKADWEGILEATLPYVDIFVPSIEELLYMLEPREYTRALAKAGGGEIIDYIPDSLYLRLAERMLSLGVKILLIKAGHRGAYLCTGDVASLTRRTALRLPVKSWSDRQAWITPFPVDPKKMQNACGAGDCAIAGFLTAILRGAEFSKAGRYAMLAGRDNLYGVDAVSGLTSWNKMTALVKS